jgi:hypothetical protein
MPRQARAVRLAAAVALAVAAWSGGPAPWLGGPVALAQAPAPAPGTWKKEFEEVCAKTQDAMALPIAELKTLVERCDKLKPAIEALGESERKVYARRLAACRNLYAYVLASRAEP